MAKLFKTLDKFKPDDNFFFDKEFEAIKKASKTRAEKKDKKFLDAVFYLGENGQGNDKKAANELLCYVISEYKSGKWDDHGSYQQRAIQVVTTHKDKDHRKGCWGFLLYYYEPEKITPELLKAYASSDNKDIKLEILQNIGDSTSGAFMNKNEPALTELCLGLAANGKEAPEMRVAAINVLGTVGRKDPSKVEKALEDLGKDTDEKVKTAAESALKALKKK